MAKFPRLPGVAAIRQTSRDVKTLPGGTVLARIYFAAGGHPTSWNGFRHYGPANARFDHHLPDKGSSMATAIAANLKELGYGG